MKSTISVPPVHKGRYTPEVLKYIKDNNIRYYTSSSEFMVLWVNGVWMSYEEAKTRIKDLPDVVMKND